MKGGGHSGYTQDEQKRLARQAVLDGRRELSPAELLEQLDTAWVVATLEHQNALAAASLSEMVARPVVVPPRDKLPEKDKQLTPEELEANRSNQVVRENIRITSNNTEVYDEAVEDEMAEDPILSALYARRTDFVNDEGYSEALRIRRTLVAHAIYTSIVEYIETSDTAA